jgi:hypothetical protein
MKAHALEMMEDYDQVLNFVDESNDYFGALRSVTGV